MQQIWNELHQLCQQAKANGEVPVAAMVVRGGEIIASAHNQVEKLKNPTAHAEMLAMQLAVNILGVKFLDDCDLYVTLEPCAMCAGAISHFRIRRLYFAAYSVKPPLMDLLSNTEIYGGIQETRFADILSDFFANKRQ